MGAKASIALFTALPIDPDELSTCSIAGERRTRNFTAPSAPRTGCLRATALISETASRIRLMAGWDFQPKVWRRKRAANSLVGLSVIILMKSRYCPVCQGPEAGDTGKKPNACCAAALFG